MYRHVGCQQHHVTGAGQHPAQCFNGSPPFEPQPSGDGIGIGHLHGCRSEPGGVHHRTRPYSNTRRIHQHQMPVGAQVAHDGRGVGGGYPVDAGAVCARLLEVGGTARWDVEALPVDGGVLLARRVLRGDQQVVAVLLNVRLAGHDLRTGGLCRGGLVQRHEGGGHCPGQQPGLKPLASGGRGWRCIPWYRRWHQGQAWGFAGHVDSLGMTSWLRTISN